MINSYSSIQTYRDCPLYFRFTQVERLPEPPSKEASFGAALHSTLFTFAKTFLAASGAQACPPLQTLLDLFDECWEGNGCASKEEIEGYRALARDILTNFHQDCHHKLRPPLAIEHRFGIMLAGVKVWGRIDWVEQTPACAGREGGALHIIDFKSGSNLPTRQDADTDYQLTLYQMAAEEAWPLPVEKLSFYHLRSGTLVSAGPRDGAHRQRLEEMVREVAEGIAAGAFEPKENFRCPCAFADRCPLFRHLYEDQVAEPGEVDIRPVVDAYAKAKEAEKTAKEQAEGLRDAIIRYCEARGLLRVFSEGYQVTISPTTSLNFAEDGVRPLLEPVGLWGKVTRFESRLVSKLLEDHSLPADLCTQLKSLAEEKTGYALHYKKRV